MGNLLVVAAEGGAVDMSTIISNIKTATAAIFELGGDAFDFMAGNALCLFMLSAGFAGFAISIVRKALRTAKRT